MPSGKEKEAQAGSNDEKVAFNLGADKEMDDGIPEGEEEDPNLDSSKVKFVNGGTAADAVVDIDGKTRVNTKAAFVGLTKDELMDFEKDPYWIKVRWILLVLFWVIWLAMLVAAIVIIVVAPKCPPRPDLQWWQTSQIKQVYPRSFLDTDSDGTGDLGGLSEKLDYLKDDSKASAVYLNPIFQSGGKDTGYDIVNHTEIDPIFGDMAAFEKLVKSMHKKEMKLILDYVPNHTSQDHPWFIKSKDREDPYTDYYVWHAGVDTGTGGRNDPPNNWRSVFDNTGSAWTWDDGRGEYYLHQFLKEQPDLNIRNPAVQEELKDILLFWLEKGVDGFRIDAVAHLFESPNMTDNEPAISGCADPQSYECLDHTLTQFQPETFAILTEWREMMDKLGKDDGKHRMLMVEAYAKEPNQTLSLFSYNGKPGAHMPTNMALLDLKKGCEAACVRDVVNSFMGPMDGTDLWPNWQTGNHDNSRIATRLESDDYVNAVNMLLLTLPGTAISYYGEEIGMTDVPVSDADKMDGAGTRDPYRTPMQWSGEAFAGFTKGNDTWLPVADNFKEKNVKAQKAHGAGNTILEVYQNVSELRDAPSFQWGDFNYAVTEGVYFYVRQAQGFEGFLVAINFGQNSATINFPKVAAEKNLIPELGQVVATTGNIKGASRAAELAIGTEVTLDNIHIQKMEGLIFKWKPEAVGKQM